jgi:hypothetical protein
MELSCGPPATMARHTNNDTTVASKVPPKASLRAVAAPPRDGRPGSWSEWLAGRGGQPLGVLYPLGLSAKCGHYPIEMTITIVGTEAGVAGITESY